MDSLEQNLKTLADRPDFQGVLEYLKECREAYISDLSQHEPASNPHLLAHLAGSISALDHFLKQVDEFTGSPGSD